MIGHVSPMMIYVDNTGQQVNASSSMEDDLLYVWPRSTQKSHVRQYFFKSST